MKERVLNVFSNLEPTCSIQHGLVVVFVFTSVFALLMLSIVFTEWDISAGTCRTIFVAVVVSLVSFLALENVQRKLK